MFVTTAISRSSFRNERSDSSASITAHSPSPHAAFVARSVVENLAIALQGALLLEHSPAPVAEAFIASRAAGRRGHTFGSLPVDLAGAADAVIDRLL